MGNLEGASFDRETDYLYATQGQGANQSGEGNALFRIDTTDATATKVGDFSQGNDFEAMACRQTATTSDTDLPVELTRFEAVSSGEAVALRWRTASETNNARFEIQRQVQRNAGDGWQTLAERVGAGTTAEATTYRYTDRGVPFTAQTVRYRLRQVNQDGTASLSGVRSVTPGTPRKVALHAAFPNPARHAATIRYALPTSAKVEMALYDVLGRKVRTLASGRQEAGRKQVHFETSVLPSGVYFYRLKTAGTVKTKRLVMVR